MNATPQFERLPRNREYPLHSHEIDAAAAIDGTLQGPWGALPWRI